ncbi:MAG: formyltetrahydrofolate deformylase [Kiritimatiellae bacterium]|nr:formyltetrahydrofolate deformylase [Kiritimatiellia bacterium]
MNRNILLVTCPDARGIVAALSGFLAGHGANILEVDQTVLPEDALFCARFAWEDGDGALSREGFEAAFAPLAEKFSIRHERFDASEKMRMGILVSREAHCFHDILARVEDGEWNVSVPLVVSNHESLAPVARRQGIPFEVVPVPKDDPAGKAAAFARTEALFREAGCDFLVLARYMQIVPPSLIAAWPMKIVNIHHSFLPAFAGAKPYAAACRRGVKLIGATAHYVTEHLDEGPIIEQDVRRVTHREGVDDLVRIGRDIEKVVLSRAIRWHLEHRILVHANRTVVFA